MGLRIFWMSELQPGQRVHVASSGRTYNARFLRLRKETPIGGIFEANGEELLITSAEMNAGEFLIVT